MTANALRSGIFLLFFLAVSIFAQAQNQSSDAHLSGTLLDSSDAAIGGVSVTAQLEGNATARLWKTSSSTDGAYSLTLPPGRYHLSFKLSPFVSRDLILDLAPSEQRKLDLSLDLERLSASVIVTAEAEPILAGQTTAPVSVITKDEIDQRQSVALTDALQFSTGIAIGRTGPEGGSASVFLNGGNSNFTKILVDGVPINPPGSAVDFSSLTLDNIDKVEIVRGAESAIYGTDAVSGVIQLFTHRGSTRTPEFSVFGEGGSFSTGRGGAQLSGLLGKFDYSAAASYMETDGQGPNDDFINRTLSGNFGYTFNDNSQLRLTIRNNTSDAGIPGQTAFTPPSLYQRYGQQIFSTGASWNFSTGKHWRHEISGGESYTRQSSDNPLQSFYATDPNAFCPQTNPTAVATAEFCDFVGNSLFQYNRANVSAQTSYSLSNFAVTAGYQYEVENAFLSSIDVNHARRNNQGGFLDFRYHPQRRVSLNFGGRVEANDYFGTRFVPRAGGAVVARYGRGFWGETLFRGFYGQGIKEPRFDQIYGDNFGDFGNPSLKPESSKTWTAGIDQKLFNDRISLSGNYFASHFYNIVSFAFCEPITATTNTCGVTIPNAPPSFGFYFNTDRARARGINLTGDARITRWLNLAGNFTYDDSRVLEAPNAFDPTELPGNHLARRPVNSGSLTLNAAYRRFGMTVSGYFSGVRTDSDFLSVRFGTTCIGPCLSSNPGYALLNIATHYDVGYGVTFYARASNLFNKQYQDALGYPALGLNVQAGVRYTFKGKD